TSEASIGLPLLSKSRISRALASAFAFSARALFNCVLSSPICWLESVVLLVPTKSLDAGLVFGHLPAQSFDFTRQPLPCRLRLLLPRILLQHQITFGDRVGDARGKFGIARLEFDDDNAGLVDGVGREAIVIGFQD